MRKAPRHCRRCSMCSTTTGCRPISISKPGRSRLSTTARWAIAAPPLRTIRNRNGGATWCDCGCATMAAAPIPDKQHSREDDMDTIERALQSETKLLQELPLRLHHNAYVVQDHEANRH